MDKFHGNKPYIHADNRMIPMNFDKTLIYVPIPEPTQWELDNIDQVMLASDHPWDPDFIKN